MQLMWNRITGIFEWWKGHFTRLFAAFRLLFEGDFYAMGVKLREIWDESWAKIKEAGEKTWAAIVKFFEEADWKKIGTDVLKGIGDGITAGVSFLTGAIKGVIKAALAAVSGFFGGAPSLPPDRYPGIPGVSPTQGPVEEPDAPLQGPASGPYDTYPTGQHLAKGTNFAPGGWSWVGEDGPELVDIPRGARVMSAPVSLSFLEDAIAATGLGKEIHHHYPVTVITQATTGTYLQDLALAQSQAI